MYGLIKKNTAQYLIFPLVDADGDFVSGATITGELNYWEDGTAPQASYTALTNAEVEIGSTGIYRVQLTTGETNHGYLSFKFTSATSKPQLLLFRTTVGDPLDLSVHDPADIWTAGSRALSTPNDYKATGFSTHSADNVWAVVSRIITGGVLTTPNDYKATGFSTHNAADIWTTGSRELSTPANYKANVSALALEATVNALNNLASSDVQVVLETNDLDHLLKVAHPTGDPVANSILDLVMNKDGTQTFARADDSLQGISEGAAGGGASAQEVWEYATGGGRELSTPANYKATGFSTHSADNVWAVVSRVITGGVLTTPNDYKASVTALALEATVAALNNITAGDVWAEVTKVITGGVLTTPADYKATGFAIPNEYDTVIATLALEATIAALNNITAGDVWSEVSKVITGGVLTTPTDYKADVSTLATSAALTTHDTDIKTETKRLRGLNGEFIVAEYTFVGSDNTVIEYWQYDTLVNFNTHNKSTGLIGSWILNNTFVSNNPTIVKSKRLT